MYSRICSHSVLCDYKYFFLYQTLVLCVFYFMNIFGYVTVDPGLMQCIAAVRSVIVLYLNP